MNKIITIYNGMCMYFNRQYHLHIEFMLLGIFLFTVRSKVYRNSKCSSETESL
jgi:hypothetical protein